MSLPIQPSPMHPNTMRKSVMNMPNNDNMRSVVQQAAIARQSGVGGRVMGGLGVGSNGQAQKFHAEAQYSVSGQRGRRAPAMNTFQPAPPVANLQQQQQQQQQQQYRPQLPSPTRTNMLLIYNGQDGQSIALVQQLIQQNSNPHPQIFKSLVRTVDSRQPDAESNQVIQKLFQLPEFHPMLQSGCILFDFGQKRAYNDYGAICQMISLQKNAAVSAILEQQFLQQQQQQQQQGNYESPPVAQYGARQVVGGIGNQERKSIRSFARRSVLGGVDPAELENMAAEANQHVRRDNVGAYGGVGGGRGRGSMMSFEQPGGAASGVSSSTLFDDLGNHEAVAGGQEGSLTQINTKAYKRQ